MKDSKLNIKYVIPVLLAFFVMSFCDLIGIGVDRAKNDFELNNFMAQLIPSAVFFWFLVLSVPVGVLQNQFGKRQVLNAGILITAVGLLLPFFFYNFELLLAGFALLGIGNTIIQVSANPLLFVIVPSKYRSGFLSFSQFVKSIGSMAGAPLAGWVALRFGDWKIAFFIFGIVSLITVLWLGRTKIKESKNKDLSVSFKSSFKLLSIHFIALAVLGIFLIVGIDVGINAISGQYLIAKFDTEMILAESGRSIYFFGKMLGTLAGAFLLTRLPSGKFLLWSSFWGFITLLLLFIIPEETVTFIIFFLIGLTIANIFPLIFYLTVNRYPKHANEISGLMIMAVSGGAVIPLLIGWLSDTFSIMAGIWTLFVAIALILAISTVISKKKYLVKP